MLRPHFSPSLLLILGLIFFSRSTIAQTADDVINKYVTKLGGKEKWQAVSSFVITGTQSINGMDVPFTISQKAPNKKRLEVSINGKSFVQCYDGKTAWMVNPFAGSGSPEIMPAADAKTFAEQAVGKPELLDYASKGEKPVLDGKETIANATYTKLLLTKKDGSTQTFYFDPASSNLSMMSMTMPSGPMQGKVIQTYFSDYRDEQGVKFPHALDLKLDNQPLSKITYSAIKVNAPVDDALFVMPATQK